uniref:Ion channel n=1 Tax=Steinernema glaseri TaxID=37863 RepID=A0A1I8A0B1_9BILA
MVNIEGQYLLCPETDNMLPSTSLSSCINRSLSSPDMQTEKRSTYSRANGFVPGQNSLDCYKSPFGGVETNVVEAVIKPAAREQRNGALMKGAAKVMSYKKRISMSSIHSDSKGHLLHNVGKTLQRTHSHLKRTRLLHVFYLLALPVYTALGAFVFQALDGEHDDVMKHFYENRCQDDRNARLQQLRGVCDKSGSECFAQMTEFILEVETCYRRWHEVNRTITHPMSDFSNAFIYAFSVYTTIGYGNMAADSVGCRVATLIYGAFGIPLFFAFVKEEGNLCRNCFIRAYNAVRRRRCLKEKTKSKQLVVSEEETRLKGTDFPEVQKPRTTVAILVDNDSRDGKTRKTSRHSLTGDSRFCSSSAEQKRVFICGVTVFVLYLLAVSGVFAYTTEWDFFTAFYFLFNSVALIGFGDVFPSQPRIILVNMIFIILGVVLFSMCYFILQEEIREKAFEASRKARMSISKYSHTIMQHTKTQWSRRNSPAFDGAGSSPEEPTNFERLKKRRQSAPAVSLNVPLDLNLHT